MNLPGPTDTSTAYRNVPVTGGDFLRNGYVPLSLAPFLSRTAS